MRKIFGLLFLALGIILIPVGSFVGHFANGDDYSGVVRNTITHSFLGIEVIAFIIVGVGIYFLLTLQKKS